MKIKLVTSILLVGVMQSVLAYPIKPRPLRKLVMESEHIVYADVVRVETIDAEDVWSRTKAILLIKERLQGSIKNDTVEVFFMPTMVCPAPANYKEGTTVLAFLDKREKGFWTHALSYGSKTIDSSVYKVYKKRVIEIQDILKIKNKSEQAEKTIDWLISCAVDPNTRWEGVYELSPQSDFMSYYDKDRSTFVRIYELNDNQKAALRKAFFKIDNLTYTDMGLIDLVIDKNDTEALSHLAQLIKESDDKLLFYLDFIATRIAELFDRDELREIAQEYDKLDYLDEKSFERRSQLTKEFVEKL